MLDDNHDNQEPIELEYVEPTVPVEKRLSEDEKLSSTHIDVYDYMMSPASKALRRRSTRRKNKGMAIFESLDEFEDAVWAYIKFVKANKVIVKKGQKFAAEIPDVMTDEMFCIFCGFSVRTFNGWGYGDVHQDKEWLEDATLWAKSMFKDQRIRGAARNEYNSTIISRFDGLKDSVSVRNEIDININSPINDLLKKLDQKLDYDAQGAFQHELAVEVIDDDDESDPFAELNKKKRLENSSAGK